MRDTQLVTEQDVSDFYDRMVFPSRTSHRAYEELVPPSLSGGRVGDFGCGQSLFLNAFRAMACRAVFLDTSENALRTIDYGLKIRASLSAIPLKDSCMEVVFCIGVLHHLPDMQKAAEEMFRTIRPGGRLYLGVYAEKSAQAFLRKMFDWTGNPAWRLGIRTLTRTLIWLKNRRNGLMYGSEEHMKRLNDLLLTPLVRYLPWHSYAEIFQNLGGQIAEMRSISSMNIFIIDKPPLVDCVRLSKGSVNHLSLTPGPGEEPP